MVCIIDYIFGLTLIPFNPSKLLEDYLRINLS